MKPKNIKSLIIKKTYIIDKPRPCAKQEAKSKMETSINQKKVNKLFVWFCYVTYINRVHLYCKTAFTNSYLEHSLNTCIYYMENPKVKNVI